MKKRLILAAIIVFTGIGTVVAIGHDQPKEVKQEERMIIEERAESVGAEEPTETNQAAPVVDEPVVPAQPDQTTEPSAPICDPTELANIEKEEATVASMAKWIEPQKEALVQIAVKAGQEPDMVAIEDSLKKQYPEYFVMKERIAAFRANNNC